MFSSRKTTRMLGAGVGRQAWRRGRGEPRCDDAAAATPEGADDDTVIRFADGTAGRRLPKADTGNAMILDPATCLAGVCQNVKKFTD